MRTATSACRSVAPSSSGATPSTDLSSSARTSGEPGTELLHMGPELGELVTDARRRRTPTSVARRHRALDGEHPAHLRREVRRHLRELVVVQVGQIAAELLASAYGGAGDLVRLTERHTVSYQPLGDVRRQREA